jgi:hypothetical protein
VFSELVLKGNKIGLSDAPITSKYESTIAGFGVDFTFIPTVWSVITGKEEGGNGNGNGNGDDVREFVEILLSSH